MWTDPTPIDSANSPGLYHPGPLFQPSGGIRFLRIDERAHSATAMMSERRGAQFGAAAPVADPPEWRSRQQHYVLHGAELSPDGRTAVFGASRIDPSTGRTAPPDAFVSRLENGRWSPLRPLGAGVNTSADENFFTFTPDGCSLLFTRDYTAFYLVSVDAAVTGAGEPIEL